MVPKCAFQRPWRENLFGQPHFGEGYWQSVLSCNVPNARVFVDAAGLLLLEPFEEAGNLLLGNGPIERLPNHNAFSGGPFASRVWLFRDDELWLGPNSSPVECNKSWVSLLVQSFC